MGHSCPPELVRPLLPHGQQPSVLRSPLGDPPGSPAQPQASTTHGCVGAAGTPWEAEPGGFLGQRQLSSIWFGRGSPLPGWMWGAFPMRPGYCAGGDKHFLLRREGALGGRGAECNDKQAWLCHKFLSLSCRFISAKWGLGPVPSLQVVGESSGQPPASPCVTFEPFLFSPVLLEVGCSCRY